MVAIPQATLIGISSSIQEVLRDLERVAGTEAAVLVSGETGTGKELVARAIHSRSPRRLGPFVPVDCGAICEELFDSELFGHARGAFTGADRPRAGKLLSAAGGTLFLDGIDSLSLPSQARLLRVIEEKEVLPLGESRARPVDFRLVTSVSGELPRLLETGAFRQDLYFRINVVQLALPPLRRRREDIPVLAGMFLRDAARRFGKPVLRLDPAALGVLQDYAWPGNVRELLGVIECAAASARGEILRESDLPVYVRVRAADPAEEPPAAPAVEGAAAAESAAAAAERDGGAHAATFAEQVEDFQRRLLLQSLQRNGWSYRACGAELGLAHHQVKYLCAKLGIRRPWLDAAR